MSTSAAWSRTAAGSSAAQDDPEIRLALASWQLTQANAAYGNASGPSPVVNALDLVTLASLSRMVAEDSIVPRFPETGQQLLATHRELEKTAWTLCEEFLTPSQIADFHGILDEWRRQHPTVRTVAFIHFLDFAKQIGRPKPGEEARKGGLFAMLGIDPLAGLDPAIREIEQTRALAERTIYYMQRMPYVLNLQLERVTSELLTRPEYRQILSDSSRISTSVERFSLVASALPAQISAEREAMVNQIADQLVAQEQTLRPLLVDLRGTLEAGSATAQALESAVRSFDALMARFPCEVAAAGKRRAWEVVPTVRHHRVHGRRRGIHAHGQRAAATRHFARCAVPGPREDGRGSGRPQPVADRLPVPAHGRADRVARRQLTGRGALVPQAQSTRSGSIKLQPMLGNFVLSVALERVDALGRLVDREVGLHAHFRGKQHLRSELQRDRTQQFDDRRITLDELDETAFERGLRRPADQQPVDAYRDKHRDDDQHDADGNRAGRVITGVARRRGEPDECERDDEPASAAMSSPSTTTSSALRVCLSHSPKGRPLRILRISR